MGLPLIGPALAWLGGGSAAAKGLGVATTALSGILGKPKTYSPSGQSYGQLMGAFRAADEAGLHRLAVAGSPAGYSPAPASAADGLMAAGQMIGQGNTRKQEQLLDAQIEEARSRTILNEANARRALAGPQPGLGGASTALMDMLSAHQDRGGGDRRVEVRPDVDAPLTGTTNAGDVTMVAPSEDAFSVGLDELIAGALIYGPQWLTSVVNRRGQQDRAAAKEPKSRDTARRSASERNRRAQESPYLFGR